MVKMIPVWRGKERERCYSTILNSRGVRTAAKLHKGSSHRSKISAGLDRSVVEQLSVLPSCSPMCGSSAGAEASLVGLSPLSVMPALVSSSRRKTSPPPLPPPPCFIASCDRRQKLGWFYSPVFNTEDKPANNLTSNGASSALPPVCHATTNVFNSCLSAADIHMSKKKLFFFSFFFFFFFFLFFFFESVQLCG